MSHLRTLLPYLARYRTPLAAGIALVVVANLFTVVSPWILRLAIDALSDPATTLPRLLTYAGWIVLTALLAGAARYGMRELMNGVSRRVECDLRSDLFRHLLTLDAPFYARERTGDLMSRATQDTLAVRNAAGPAIMYAVNTLVLSILALALMFWISPGLTGVVLLPMALLPPVALGFGRLIHHRFERIQEEFAALSTLVQENLTGVRVVRAYVQEGDQERRFEAQNQRYRSENLQLARVESAFHPLLGLLTSTALILVLWVGGRGVMGGTLSVGDVVAFLFYLGLLTWPMIALGWVVNLFQRGEASMGRLRKLLEARPSVDPHLGSSAPRLGGEVELREVTFRYPGMERPVLQGVSARIAPGETVAIVGPTGSGKSTLVSLLPRLWDPDSGEVLLDGVPLRTLRPGDVRARIGMVPQEAFLFSETIAANLGLGRSSWAAPEERDPHPGRELTPQAEHGLPPLGDIEPPQELIVAARIARLDDQIRTFPGGYSTRLGERGVNLSGGQRQRATLARALARDPDLLILDDALSAVDAQTEAQILRALREARRGRTTFVVSHRMTAVMEADRILVLDQGKLVETGRHEELLAADGVYARLLRRQLIEEGLTLPDRAPVGEPAIPG